VIDNDASGQLDRSGTEGLATAGVGEHWDEGLHHGPASFETRLLGAPQDEGGPLMALGKFLILRRSRKATVSKGARCRSSQPGFLVQPLGSARPSSSISMRTMK